MEETKVDSKSSLQLHGNMQQSSTNIRSFEKRFSQQIAHAREQLSNIPSACDRSRNIHGSLTGIHQTTSQQLRNSAAKHTENAQKIYQSSQKFTQAEDDNSSKVKRSTSALTEGGGSKTAPLSHAPGQGHVTSRVRDHSQKNLGTPLEKNLDASHPRERPKEQLSEADRHASKHNENAAASARHSAQNIADGKKSFLANGSAAKNKKNKKDDWKTSPFERDNRETEEKEKKSADFLQPNRRKKQDSHISQQSNYDQSSADDEAEDTAELSGSNATDKILDSPFHDNERPLFPDHDEILRSQLEKLAQELSNSLPDTASSSSVSPSNALTSVLDMLRLSSEPASSLISSIGETGSDVADSSLAAFSSATDMVSQIPPTIASNAQGVGTPVTQQEPLQSPLQVPDENLAGNEVLKKEKDTHNPVHEDGHLSHDSKNFHDQKQSGQHSSSEAKIHDSVTTNLDIEQNPAVSPFLKQTHVEHKNT